MADAGITWDASTPTDELRALGRGIVAAIDVADRMGDAAGVAALRARADALLAEIRRRAAGPKADLALRRGEPGYPPLLAATKSAPETLYVRGDAGALAGPCVAVVGTRQASQAGLAAARAIGLWCAARGVCVVSGLALGIDAAAHEAALEAGGRTVAVLAHGLDTVYPAEHAQLARDIVGQGGALVSEHPDGTKAARHTFVTRNRIQAGLSLAVVLVESRVPGGGLYACEAAARANRMVLAVLPTEAPPSFAADGAHYAADRYDATLIAGTKHLGLALGELLKEAGR